MELTSNIGMMVLIHILYIQPVDINSQNIFRDNQFYSLWIVSCLLKVFRLNRIFMSMINYKIIINTITDVFPLIKDLLTLFVIVIFFGATVFMSIFGGAMSDDYQ